MFERVQESDSDNLSTNLLQYGITQVYYNQVDKATGLLREFYEKHLKVDNSVEAINKRFECDRAENILVRSFDRCIQML